jgi:hypothetical protein
MGPMNNLQSLIDQMAVDISSQAAQLDDLRLPRFLAWLDAHSIKVKIAADANESIGNQVPLDVALDQEATIEERLKLNLKTWFESLPLRGLLWEYHLILDEIAWWRDLDPHRLNMILRPEEKN